MSVSSSGPSVGMTGAYGNLRFIGTNEKIADITEADINKHTVDISAYVPANCVAIVISARRVSGTGNILFFPNEGAQAITDATPGYLTTDVIAIVSQRLQYNLSVANDDFDLYMFGYFTEG